MSYANSTLNPIIYAYSNELFRKNLFNLKCCLKKSRRRRSNQATSVDYNKSSARPSHPAPISAAYDRNNQFENSSLISNGL